MTKKHIHLIVPDKFQQPLGGMGVGARNFVEQLSSDFDFTVIGFPEQNDMLRYVGAYNLFPGIEHSSLVTLAGQGSYFAASASLPKPDLVHAYDWTVYLGALQAARHFGVPLIASMRLSINLLSELDISYVRNIKTEDGFWINRMLRDMELLGLQESTHITQVSEAYAKRFAVIPGLAAKTTIVPNGISLEKWQHFSKKTLPGNSKIKLVYIGRFAAMKGVLALCKADIPPQIDLIFIGSDAGSDPQVFAAMKSKVAQHANVHHIGPLYGQDKIDALNSADAVIIPSLHEPFGIVALEALASNNILLSSFVDGMSDFLTAEAALFCGSTKNSIENALFNIIAMSDTEKHIRKQRGLEICRRYSWLAAAAQLKSVYDRF